MKTKKDGFFFSAEVKMLQDTRREAQACSKVSTQREGVRVQAVDMQQYSPSTRCGGNVFGGALQLEPVTDQLR